MAKVEFERDKDYPNVLKIFTTDKDKTERELTRTKLIQYSAKAPQAFVETRERDEGNWYMCANDPYYYPHKPLDAFGLESLKQIVAKLEELNKGLEDAGV